MRLKKCFPQKEIVKLKETLEYCYKKLAAKGNENVTTDLTGVKQLRL